MNLSTSAAVLLAGLIVVSCGSEKPTTSPRPTPTATLEGKAAQSSRSVIDMVGRSVRVPDSVNRVVTITPSAADFAITLGLNVVGRTTDVTSPAAASATTVGSSLAPDFNAIAALNPDLVIGDSAFDGARLRDFERFAYPVFLLQVSSYDSVLVALGVLGEAVGKAQQGRDAAAALAVEVDAMVQRFSGRPAPTVVIFTGSGREVYAGSSQTYIGSLIAKLGATNLLADSATGAPIPGFGTVEVTAIASKNPDLVLTLASGSGGLAGQISASPAWANSNAVKSGRVFELDTNAFLRAPGPGVLSSLQILARLLYPR